MAKLGILTLHGMGNVGEDFDAVLQEELRDRWGSALKNEIAFQSIHYHPAMQGQQEATLDRMHDAHKLSWRRFREFFVYSFSDATTYHLFPEDPTSVYQKVHRTVQANLTALRQKLEQADNPIVIIAHSLGCQVVSNYIWDVQRGKGIWATETPSGYNQLKGLQLMLTTGCNIPLFVSGLSAIQPFNKPHPDFQWLNFFDNDDVLGWPLQPLSDSYRQLVKDRPIQTGITPLSHAEYWRDRDFLNPAAIQIEDLYQRNFG